MDFYDMIEWCKRGGYQGSVLLFYDYQTGEVYQPFRKRRNVIYGRPICSEGAYYFLQGDFTEGKIRLYRFVPREPLSVVTAFSTSEVELYNLRLVGEGVHVISEDEEVAGYYPERFRYPKDPHEAVEMIFEGKIYAEKWVEKGWDEENEARAEKIVAIC